MAEWPARLLHVPTWTSYAQTKPGVYNNVESPKYNVLSYTWGRWEAPSGEAISIGGITWKIPCIDPAHFTKDEFRKTVESVRHRRKEIERVDWVWLDISCIDQENGAAKAIEVGRQALIFRKATQAYVWLVSFSTEELRLVLKDLLQYGSPFEARQNAILRLLQDPYFSSLWTLQEAFLKSDAILLSREGDTVTCMLDSLTEVTTHVDLHYFDNVPEAKPGRLEKYKVSLDDILDAIKDYTNEVSLRSIASRAEPSDEDPLQVAALAKIEASGIAALNCRLNPFLIYNTASLRKVHSLLDRVYAIMQIYELRLGSSAHPERKFSLAELEDQLIDGFLQISPMLSQLFVHTRPPKDGCSWRMNKDSASLAFNIAIDLMTYTASSSGYAIQSTFEKEGLQLTRNISTGALVWRGSGCSLQTAAVYWTEALKHRSSYINVGFPYEFKVSIQFDASHIRRGKAPEAQNLLPATETSLAKAIDAVDAIYGLDNLWVLRMSRVPTQDDSTGRRTVWAWAAVIAVQECDKRYIRRIGICVWDMHYFPRVDDFEDVRWGKFEGEMM